jgi:hypothetical protein
MNDIDDLATLRRSRGTFGPAHDEPPASLRIRTVAGFCEPATRPDARWMPGLRWTVGAPAALAALTLVGVVAVGGLSDDGAGSGTPGPSTPHASTEGLAPAQILARAANAQRVASTPVPRPDQFLYVESLEINQTMGSQDVNQTSRGVSRLRKVWLSIDGTHDGLIRQGPAPGYPADSYKSEEIVLPGCRNGRSAAIGPDASIIPGKYEVCHQPTPVYRADLPTDGADMLRYIRASAGDQPDSQFNGVMQLLGEWYLTAEQRSALFEAAALIPGVVAVADAVDLAGRHGVAVSITGPHPRYVQVNPTTSASTAVLPPNLPEETRDEHQLIFDPKTYAYLGYRRIVSTDPTHTWAGSSVLATGIVDKIG